MTKQRTQRLSERRMPPPGWAEAVVNAAPPGSRDRQLVEVLYSTGARITDVLNLQWRDIEFAHARAYVRQKKNGSWYYMRFSPAALGALQQRKNAGLPRPFGMSRATAHRIVRHLCDQAGVKPLGPHGFRHSLARRILDRTGNVRLAQQILGHASVESIMAYTELMPDQVDEAHARLWK